MTGSTEDGSTGWVMSPIAVTSKPQEGSMALQVQERFPEADGSCRAQQTLWPSTRGTKNVNITSACNTPDSTLHARNVSGYTLLVTLHDHSQFQ